VFAFEQKCQAKGQKLKLDNKTNPDKFQAIAVGKKTYAKEPVFNIESANISCDEVVKLLGIDIDSMK
jgi:hypothetical protein